MNCDEVEDLIGAYALGALPVETLGEIGEHLATCEKHPEAAELQAVGASLAFAAPEREPPLGLKSRLMEVLRDEPAAAAPARAERTGFFQRIGRWRPQSAVPYALAGALAVAVAALIITNVGDSDETQTARVTLTGADSAQAVLHVLEDGLVVMEADGLQPLDSEQTYQVWAIRGGRPESMGLLGPATEGEVEEAMRADLSGIEAVAVTIEPAGGSEEPTGERVLESDEVAIP
jgi:anti-sigma-K factor RskA